MPASQDCVHDRAGQHLGGDDSAALAGMENFFVLSQVLWSTSISSMPDISGILRSVTIRSGTLPLR